MDYYSLNRSQKDGRLSSSGWSTHSGHFITKKWSSVDHKSGIWESSPAKDRRLKHWATPPWPYKTAFAFLSCSSWTKNPRNAHQWLLAIQSILWLHRIKLGVWQQMAILTTSIYIEPLAPYVQGCMQGWVHARRHGGALGCQAPPVAAGAPPDENSADGITCLRSSTIV